MSTPETDQPPLRLGTDREWGGTVCQFGLEGPECDKPATRHFMWLNNNGTSLACDEHAAYIHSRDTSGTPFDEHTRGADCGMPGSMWQFPYEDQDEGWCFMPMPDDASLLAEGLVGVLPRHGLLADPERGADLSPRHAREARVLDGTAGLARDAGSLRGQVSQRGSAGLWGRRAAFLFDSHPSVAQVIAVVTGRDDLPLASSQVGAVGSVVAVDAVGVPVRTGDPVPRRRHMSTLVDARPNRQHMLSIVKRPDERDPTPCPKCGETCTYDGWDHVHANGLGIGSCVVKRPESPTQPTAAPSAAGGADGGAGRG